ncbi:3619_t:CDS:2, partial [Diversispora eburnea]
SLSNPDALLEKMIKYKPTGGTSFNNGIKKASQIIDNYHKPSKTNVVIFLSDGEDSTPEQDLRILSNTTSIVGGFFDLFGGNSHDQGSLQEMANIAKGYLPKSSNNKDSLKCEYVRVIDQINLIGHFYEDTAWPANY